MIPIQTTHGKLQRNVLEKILLTFFANTPSSIAIEEGIGYTKSYSIYIKSDCKVGNNTTTFKQKCIEYL